jgi:hypothetical protein
MLTVTDNIPQFLKAFEAAQKAAGFAEVVALTRTARAAAAFESQEAARVFDRPTPFTLNAFYWRPATPDRKTFEVGVKDSAFKGTPASKYLRAEIMGGNRRPKRSENALASLSLNATSGNRAGFWVPGAGVKLDAYGNVPGGTIKRILADLRVAGDQSRTTRSRARNKRYRGERYFVPTATSGLKPGVWVERAGKIAPALIFIAMPRYTVRFEFITRGMAFAASRFAVEMDQALREGWHLPRTLQKALGLGGRI